MNDATWILGLEAAVTGAELTKSPQLFRQAAQVLYTRFPQHGGVGVDASHHPKVASVASRLLRLALSKSIVDEDGLAVEVTLRSLCLTGSSPSAIYTLVSNAATEPIGPRTMFWMASLSKLLAQQAPSLLVWLAQRLGPERGEQEGVPWFSIRDALARVAIDPEGVRVISSVIEADVKTNPGIRYVGDGEELVESPDHSRAELTVGGYPAVLLADGRATKHLELGDGERSVLSAIQIVVDALVARNVDLSALKDTAWPTAFWRQLLIRAQREDAFVDTVWDLACSDELMRAAPAPAVEHALNVIRRGRRLREVEQTLRANPEGFRALNFCLPVLSEIASDVLTHAVELRGRSEPYASTDLEPQFTSGWVVNDNSDWWLRSRGIDLDAHAEPLRLRALAEAFWTEFLNKPSPRPQAREMVRVLDALCSTIERTPDDNLNAVLSASVLRACRSLLLSKDPTKAAFTVTRRALRLTFTAGDDDAYAEAACMLLHRAGKLDEEHRTWLLRARGDKPVANSTFRLHLRTLHRFDADWAWRELLAWSQEDPDEWFSSVLPRFWHSRKEQVAALAIETETRLDADPKAHVTLGDFIACVAIVERSPRALEWMDTLALGETSARSVRGVLWWMRTEGWVWPSEEVRQASWAWLPPFAASVGARALEKVGHELVFSVSAFLTREPSPPAKTPKRKNSKKQVAIELAAREAMLTSVVREWRGVAANIARAIPLSPYEVWHFLPVLKLWAEHHADEAATALQILIDRSSKAGAPGLVMEMGDIVGTVEAIAEHVMGRSEGAASVLDAIERLVLTRHPTALSLLPLRLRLARSLPSA